MRGVAIAGLAVLVLGLLAAGAIWRTRLMALPHDTGYFAPLFTPDGKSVLTITREAGALVTGAGREFFTPPATVRLQRDRFALVSIRIPDGQATVMETFPPSPLEGQSILAYYGAIFGVAHAHLRWGDGTHLDYEIAVTRHDTPLARTFVTRQVWNPTTRTYAKTTPWQETHAVMSGDEPQQLHGDMEAIAVPGDELMPCAISLLRGSGDTVAAATLVETDTCRRKYPGGIPVSVLTSISRRADILRSETIRSTYADLVARGLRSGRTEGQAMLDANKEMQRLGYYPKTPTLVASPASCDSASPLFSISDAEFTYGLFPDIEAAIKSPGTEVDKSMGAYITHRDYTTSREINEYLDAGHSTFFARARDACWRISINRQ